MNLRAHNFPHVYQSLGIDLSKLGCVMLDLNEMPEARGIDLKGDPFYHAADPSHFWIKGWVFDNPHVTLLYGLMTPANETPNRELVPEVLKGWDYPTIEIDSIGYFESPYQEEPYWCIVAMVRVNAQLQEGHDRVAMLPHINTFPGYKPHATIAYIKKSLGDNYRDNLIESFNQLFIGKTLSVKGINLGGNQS